MVQFIKSKYSYSLNVVDIFSALMQSFSLQCVVFSISHIYQIYTLLWDRGRIPRHILRDCVVSSLLLCALGCYEGKEEKMHISQSLLPLYLCNHHRKKALLFPLKELKKWSFREMKYIFKRHKANDWNFR